MTLIETLRRFTIDNLDTDDVLYDGSWYDDNQKGFEFFLHNLQALLGSSDAETWEKMNSLEINEDILVDLRDNEGENYFGDVSITHTILNAAWLTHRDIDYAERIEQDDYDDLCEDVYNYGFTFEDFDFFFQFEADIDLL